MRHITLSALSLILVAGAASAQTMDISSLKSIDDADVVNADGDKIGEIEELLVDESGAPVAAVVEVGGILDIGDEDIVISLDELTYEDGDFSTSMTEEEMEELPEWDD